MEETILALSSETNSAPNSPQPQKTASTTASATSPGGWWGLGWGIVDTVKKQAETVISIYKEDIQEFTKIIQEDVKDAIKKTAEVTNNMAAANSAPQKSKMDELELSLDRRQARVTALQNELRTFVTEPAEAQDFQEWKSTWNIQSHTEQISILLAENEKMRAIHTKLVPVVISYATFWERYFYKLHKLLLEEERRAALVQKAVATNDDEEIAWDDDIDGVLVYYSSNVVDATPRKEIVPETEPEVPKAELEDYFNKLDVEDNTEEPQQQAPSSPTKEAIPVQAEKELTPPTTPTPVSSAPATPVASPPATPAASTPTTVNTTPAPTTKKGPEEEEAWDNWE